MTRTTISILWLLCCCCYLTIIAKAFSPIPQSQHTFTTANPSTTSSLMACPSPNHNNERPLSPPPPDQQVATKPDWLMAAHTTVGAALLFFVTSCSPLTALPAHAATSSNDIVSCLFQKCSVSLGKCVLNPKCLANVICINTCPANNPVGCQIQCGDVFENEIVGEFNKCVISEMSCVPQKQDDGSYPTKSRTVDSFNTNFFNEKLYITAGQNKLFDIFPCQVHFFTETSPGRFFGKLNWRVTEPDGEYFTRDALQEFYQDPNDPSHLINHDNEYLHYQDDWWIIDYDYGNTPNVPKFAMVYYRGSNDAWDGYGGVVVYTRVAQLPNSLLPRLRTAAATIGYDFDRDFALTDNSCPVQTDNDKLVLREQFAGKVILNTESNVQAAATRLRGNAVNSVKAQKLFFEDRFESASRAFTKLQESQQEFEESSSSR